MRTLAHPVDFLPMYTRLKSQSQTNKAILEAINNVKQQLERSDKPLGVHHKKKQIPQCYKTRYNLQILYHFDMPNFHRLMYTVRRSPEDGEIEAIFLELLTHEQYNKRFGYFKKKSH